MLRYYKITATYEYEGIVEGHTPEEAEQNFLADLNSHYSSTESYEIERVCKDCNGELDADESCFTCRDDEEEAE
jgi:hypothetical protein